MASLSAFKNVSKNVLLGLLRSSFLLYLLTYILMLQILNEHRIKGRILSYLKTPIDYILSLSNGDASIDPDALRSNLIFYKKMQQYLPDNAEGHFLAGYCSYQLEETQKAILSYKKAVELNPSFFWSAYDLGVIYFKKGDYENAALTFEHALNADPAKTLFIVENSGLLNSWRAFDPGERNEKRNLQNIFSQRIIHLKEARIRTLKALILCYEQEKDYQRMLATAIKGIKQNPQDTPFFYLKAGVASYYLKNFKTSLAFLEKAVQKSPSSEVYDYLALNLKELGNPDLARSLEKKGAILKDSDPKNSSPVLELKIY